MKVRITHLKAPWPSGFGVGDVVDVEMSPAFWGKCEPVAENAVEFVTNPDFQATEPGDERDALRDARANKGLKPDSRWGLAKLKAELAKVKA